MINIQMDELLHQIDLDYYRSALLLVARAALERLRQECSSEVEKQRKASLDASVAGGRRGSVIEDGA
jgi:hypothetical protein